MTSEIAKPNETAGALLPAGWVVAASVALMAYIAKPEDELGFAIVVGALTLGMAFWTFRTRSRVAAITSIVLGVLWTLMFAAYAVANFTNNDDVEALVRVADIVAVLGGAMILAGAIGRLRHRAAG